MEPNRAPLPADFRLPLRLYRALFPAVFLAMLPGFLARMARRGNYRHKFGQRFGLFSPETRRRLATGGWYWVHAVSVGEMVMALRLARELRAARPGLPLLLSTTTSTGFALAAGEIAALDESGPAELIYYPVDFTPFVRRVLNLVRPARLILVDKELWPNMVAETHRRGIPIAIVNARLSPRSERGFLKWRRWVAPLFSMIDRVCVQEPEEVARWHRLGVRKEALTCTGSLKFDFAQPDGPSHTGRFSELLARVGIATGDDGNAPILLGGSTFPGEEAALGRALLALRPRFPRLFLIVVPRHVERTPQVEADLRRLGLCTLLRSDLGTLAPAGPPPDVLIVNTTGELRHWYGLATLCFIGKSLFATGGQNPAEPLLAGRPVFFGPQMQNFAPLVRALLAAKGAVQVEDETALQAAAARLLSDPEARRALVAHGVATLRAHEGATRRTVALLLLPGEKEAPTQEKALEPPARIF